MLRFAIVLALALAAITSAQEKPEKRSYNHYAYSAASDSQIKNALENNYDDTGPGAKTPDQAFKTYSNLEDALLHYLDDPDTKLPDHERAKAVERLITTNQPNPIPSKYLPKFTNEYVKIRPIQDTPLSLNKFGFNNRDIYHQYLPYGSNLDFRAAAEGNNLAQLQNLGQVQNLGVQTYPKVLQLQSYGPQTYTRLAEPIKLQTLQGVKSSPLSLAHYTRAPEGTDEYNPNPQYSFSYGVHDKQTGDSKSAHESREGGLVRGYYTFLDADGKQRTVRYTADDKQGFRATVERTQTNAQ